MKKTYVIATAMSAFIIFWMVSSLLFSNKKQSYTEAKRPPKTVISVQTNDQVAEPIQILLHVQGQVEANRVITIRSEISGRVEDFFAQEGDWVEADSLLVRLDMEDRLAQKAQQIATLQSRRGDYERARSLAKENFQSESVIEEAFAALKSAEASLEHINLEIFRTEVRAPFSGFVEKYHVEIGEYIGEIGEIADYVEINPLVVVVPVAQHNIQKVSKGTKAQVSFATGENREGAVRFISPRAQQSTRTFRVEIVVENPDNEILAGTSADVHLLTGKVTGHFVSSALLGLDDDGIIGIKTVNTNNRVVFYPVSIISALSDGVWVTGLPDRARIITTGHGFVDHGVVVKVSDELSSSDASEHVTGLPHEQGY